jgi:hypothetical protein
MPTDIFITRWSGIGDVLMALCAAHAYRAVDGGEVYFWTAPALRPLAKCCPWVNVLESFPADPVLPSIDLSDCSHGIGREHEVDSFCRRLGLTEVLPIHKTLDLDLPPMDPDFPSLAFGWLGGALQRNRSGDKMILLHPGITDPNRTWPTDYWLELAHRLLMDGHIVALIGGEKEGQPLDLGRMSFLDGSSRFPNLIGKLSLMGTIQAMRMADVVVSADAGPIQLAGASEAAIVGLYSVASGAHRAPYRHGRLGWRFRSVPPACHHFPCYPEIQNPAVWGPQRDRLMAEGHLALGAQLGHWCLRPDRARYDCLRKDITPARVYAAVLDTLVELS